MLKRIGLSTIVLGLGLTGWGAPAMAQLVPQGWAPGYPLDSAPPTPTDPLPPERLEVEQNTIPQDYRVSSLLHDQGGVS